MFSIVECRLKTCSISLLELLFNYYSVQTSMNVVIPVRITAVQMQHVLILSEAITVLVTVVTLEMASRVKV